MANSPPGLIIMITRAAHPRLFAEPGLAASTPPLA